MKKLSLLLALLTFAVVVNAQTDTTKTWKTGGVGTLNFTQVALSNWAAGGASSVSGVAFVNAFANWKKGKSSWDNNISVGYGLIKEEDLKIVKSDDRLELNSKYGQEAFKHWYYSGLVNFRTQFTPGFSNPQDEATRISDLLAPGYLVAAIGMDYKPSDNMTLFISPFTGKTTFVLDDSLANVGAFGVEPAEVDPVTMEIITEGKQIRNEFGGFVRLNYKRDLLKNVKFVTNLDLFSNYLNNPQNIDVNWEVLIAMKVNEYLSANVNTFLIYDDDIDIAETDGEGNVVGVGPRTQFKEVFGIGLTYKF